MNETPKIKTIRFWHPARIRELCIEQNWYTCGTNSEYSAMFNMVRDGEPTPEMIWKVANDIFQHSDQNYWFNGGCTEDEAVESIMFEIERSAVNTSFEVIW